MTASNPIKIEVGNELIAVPVYKDEDTTRDIVRQVNQRLAEIEEQEPGRLNSRILALKAAVAFAMELRQAQADLAQAETDAQDERKALEEDFKAEQAQETRQLMVVLDRIAETIQATIDEARAVNLDS
ncbi:MAG TPA: cell division protein ZapA [Candidatus Hydrogenedentes bacterium]|nr:cell division protein ZapA [Candidatus Hydrogenedentota bacterium]HPG65315.1 cell division protein ZapA [Candidatus Hydrogenedentota bacterium]